MLLAIDIGGTAIKAGIIGEDGKIFYKAKFSSNINNYSKPLIEAAKDAVESVYEYSKEQNLNVVGIAVSSAGQINNKTGQVIGACGNVPGWIGVNIKKEFEEKFNLRTHVENDANCAALAEKWIGAGKPFDCLIAYTIGTGIGGGIINNGTLQSGSLGIGGEIGHMIVEVDGRQCTCGSKGCWEQYASMTALVRSVKDKIGQENNKDSIINRLTGGNKDEINGEIIFEAAQKGDKLAFQCINEFIKYNAIGIVSLLHIFNPEAVIIGGGVSKQGSRLINSIKEEVFKRAMPAFTSKVKILAAELKNDAGMIGAVKAYIDEEDKNNKIFKS